MKYLLVLSPRVALVKKSRTRPLEAEAESQAKRKGTGQSNLLVYIGIGLAFFLIRCFVQFVTAGLPEFCVRRLVPKFVRNTLTNAKAFSNIAL